MSDQTVNVIVLSLGLIAYATAVMQMIQGVHKPSFFSRGVWFLLGIISFAGVYFGEGSSSAVALAATLLAGNAAVFAFSWKLGSREFGTVERFGLLLLFIAVIAWATFNSPFLALTISLIAHFIGGIPTLWRVYKRPESEQAYHWYFFFTGCLVSIIASEDKALTAILFPLYFAVFDGLVIILANRGRFMTRTQTR